MEHRLKTAVESLDLSKLEQFPGNPQIVPPAKMAMMVQAMKERGWYGQMPLVWLCPDDMKHYIVSGNHRVQAAVEAGIAERHCEIIIDDRYNWKRAGADVMMFNNIHGEPDLELERALIESLLSADTDMAILAKDIGVTQEVLELIAVDIPIDYGEGEDVPSRPSKRTFRGGGTNMMILINKIVLYTPVEEWYQKSCHFHDFFIKQNDDNQRRISAMVCKRIADVLSEVYQIETGHVLCEGLDYQHAAERRDRKYFATPEVA